jgi:eukaryotic-like serine/threonine-protein kinase
MSDGAARLPDLEPGTPVGEYVVRGKIGGGGMGQVYAGEQPLIGKQVAIKVLSSDLLQDQPTVQRLLEEARAVNLIRHPNIIDIFSFGTLPDRRPYFVMEFLEGESLEAVIARDAVSAADLTAVCEQLCQALGAAHAAGFVHRDLKPDNLWLERKPGQAPRLKVLDFGIAKNLRAPSPGLTVQGQVMGTAHYMAPEQALARTVDGRTDIYATGVILYRVLAGTLPFDDPNLYSIVVKQVTEEPRAIPPERKVPKDLEGIVMRCLAKDPARRPQTAAELWSELRAPLMSRQDARDREALLPTVFAPPRGASTAGAGSHATIQPVEGRLERTETVARGGRPWIRYGALAAGVVAGGIGLYTYLLLPGPEPARLQVAPRGVFSYDSAPPASADSATLSPSSPRDSGGGGSPGSPTSAPRPRPSKRASHDDERPIRL